MAAISGKGRTPDRDRLLTSLPQDGSFRTNKDVRDLLGLTPERYWQVRDALEKEGKIVKGRGQGGTIALKISEPPKTGAPDAITINEAVQQATVEIKEEAALYDRFAASIEKRARDEGSDQTVVEITAKQGRRQTGGEWSRPDICQVSVRKLEYLGQKVVEVTTFELKTSDCDVSSVYEALSHSRRAHRSFLAIHNGNERDHVFKIKLDRIKAECLRYGVGLIVFSDPGDFETFVTYVEPRANWVDLSDVNEFISTQISGRDRIRRWL